MSDDDLTPKQARFVDEYLKDSNATQAAIRAGYSEKTAYSIGSENLNKPEIAAAIASRRERVATEANLTLGAHFEKLAEIRDSAVSAKQFGPAVTAEVSRGKAAGFYVDRTEVTGANGGPVRLEPVVWDFGNGRRITF